MSQYTRVTIIARKHILEEAADILGDSCKNLVVGNTSGEYSEMFFEFNHFDDIGFFEDLCEEYPNQEIFFESSVELSYETNKYINLNGKLEHIYFSNNYHYYDDESMNNIIWPKYNKKIYDLEEEIKTLRKSEEEIKNKLEEATKLIDDILTIKDGK